MHYEFPNEESTAMKHAVSGEGDVTEYEDIVIHHEFYDDVVTLAEEEPDVIINIDATKPTTLYRYQMVDTGKQMTHTACGQVIGAEDSNSFLYTVTAALKSILHQEIVERLCQRYNFSSFTDAIESEKRLIVLIGVNKRCTGKDGLDGDRGSTCRGFAVLAS
jgi:hypothetical protein